MAATGTGVQQGMAAMQAWLREAIVKWVFAAFLLLVGGGLAFVGRMQQQETLFWAGAALVFLIGSVGLWAPGLGRRTRLAVVARPGRLIRHRAVRRTCQVGKLPSYLPLWKVSPSPGPVPTRRPWPWPTRSAPATG